MPWLVWLVIALICLAGEALTTALVLASFALAAALTAILAGFVVVPIQVASFAVLSLVVLLLVRPVAMKLLPQSDATSTQSLGPVGKQALTESQVDRRQGQIRVGNGEFWSARPVKRDEVIAPGQSVEVVGMSGLTALVSVSEATTPEIPVSNQIVAQLSNREVEVLKMVALGLTNQQIADQLFLSPRTVDHHVSHILDKLNANSRVDAVRMAMEQGVVGRD